RGIGGADPLLPRGGGPRAVARRDDVLRRPGHVSEVGGVPGGAANGPLAGPPFRGRLGPAPAGPVRAGPAGVGAAGAGALRDHRGGDRGLEPLRWAAAGGPGRLPAARGGSAPGRGGRGIATGRAGVFRLPGESDGQRGSPARWLAAYGRRG